jgi:hypothetical protein
MNRNYVLHVNCTMCDEETQITVVERDLTRWRKGELLQVAMPYLTPNEREMLISGTCEQCWTKLFGADEDDEDEETTCNACHSTYQDCTCTFSS